MMFKGVLPLLIALVLGVSAQAEEGLPGRTAGAGAAAKDKAEGATKDAGTRAAGAREKADGPVETHVGVLEKSSDAKFAAVLKSHGKSLNLIATGELAQKLSDLAAKGAKARVSGTDAANDAVNVTKVLEAGEKAGDGDKPKKKKKGDDK
jgi:hypothetical protein